MGCGAIMTTEPPAFPSHLQCRVAELFELDLGHFGEGGQFSSRHRRSVLVRQQPGRVSFSEWSHARCHPR